MQERMKKAREGSAEYLKSLSQTRPGVLVLEGAGTMDFPEFRVSGRVLQDFWHQGRPSIMERTDYWRHPAPPVH